MKYVLPLLILALFFSCTKNSSEQKGSEDTAVLSKADSLQSMADSLEAVTDSIANARYMHSQIQGMHLHDPNANLAEVAHQDPAKTRRIRRSIYKNKEKRAEAYRNQTQRMMELLEEKKREREMQDSAADSTSSE